MATKTALMVAALCLSASGAYAQDKGKPKKDQDQDPVLKEMDKRMKAQGDELLRAVEKLLDERLGKAQKGEEKKEAPRKKEMDEKKDDGASVLKEVDRRLKAQREEILRGVEKLLDTRLGKGSRMYEEKGGPGKKEREGYGRGPGQFPPGLAMQRGHLPPGLAKKFAQGKSPKMEEKKKYEEGGNKNKKKKEDDER